MQSEEKYTDQKHNIVYREVGNGGFRNPLQNLEHTAADNTTQSCGFRIILK